MNLITGIKYHTNKKNVRKEEDLLEILEDVYNLFWTDFCDSDIV